MEIEHPLVDSVTARETNDEVVIRLPPAGRIGFEEASWSNLLRELRLLAAGLAVFAAVLASLRYFDVPALIPEWALRLILLSGLCAIGFGYHFARDALLMRWAPLRIELRNDKLRYGRRLLGGLLRSIDEIDADEVRALKITAVLTEPGHHEEPGYLEAYHGDDSSFLVAGEYPARWLGPVATLLARHLGVRRDPGQPPVRVVEDHEDFDDRDLE